MIAGWDFYFLKVLLASSEERVFFPPGKLNINIGWRKSTLLALTTLYNQLCEKLACVSPSRAPVLSFARYFQAPATQASEKWSLLCTPDFRLFSLSSSHRSLPFLKQPFGFKFNFMPNHCLGKCINSARSNLLLGQQTVLTCRLLHRAHTGI